MEKITVQVEGMACSMCESHVNDAIRKAFPIQKVTSSHSKNETVILTENPIDENELCKIINQTGYTAGTITSSPWKKRSLFSRK